MNLGSLQEVDPAALWIMGYAALRELEQPYGFAASDAAGLYSTLFGRDSLWMLILIFEAAQFNSSRTFLEWAKDAGARILKQLSEFQGEHADDVIEEQPGKIVHEYHPLQEPLTEHVLESGLALRNGRSYSGFDQTFLFIPAFKLFSDRFPDHPVSERVWPNVQRALDWIERYADEDGDGLFEYRRRNAVNHLNQVWKDSFDSATHTGFDVPPGPLSWVEVQGYAFRALMDGAELFRARGDASRADELSGRAEKLKAKVNNVFWLEAEQCFAMALDGQKRPVSMVSSNPAHALWAGIVDQSHQGELVHRLLQRDMMTSYGLRTLSAHSPYYAPFAYHRGSVWPFDSAIFAAGLLRLSEEYKHEARTVMVGVGKALLRIGTPVETYVVLDPELFVWPLQDTPVLTYRRLSRSTKAAGQAVPENQTQGFTAAALLFFGAALARIAGRRLPDA